MVFKFFHLEQIKTKSELLIEDFKKFFKTIKIKNTMVTVSDGINEQCFCVDNLIITNTESYYNSKDGLELAELVWMNFKHIIED